ncbi:MAG: adenine deaminase [Phocaeicola sp.]
MKYQVEGKIVDIIGREIFEGSIQIEHGVITQIKRHPVTATSYLMPGFIDAHMHIESTMMTPESFGWMAIQNGTIAVVSDPHEIANVMNVEGIEYMVESAKKAPFHCFFTIPSCVPATPFDAAGGIIDSTQVATLAASNQFVGLSEVMDIPGVVNQNKEVMAKLAAVRHQGLPIDGHAPLLRGEQLRTYASHGITTDHESSSLEEAMEKIALGIKIQIREGSAARNYEALHPLIESHPSKVMFCTDDSHPHEIIEKRNVRAMVIRSIAHGYNPFDVLKIACINPIEHYKLPVGGLQVGDKADFIVVKDLVNFELEQLYLGGQEQLSRVAPSQKATPINQFNLEKITATALQKEVTGTIPVIALVKDELTTLVGSYTPQEAVANLESDLEEDIVKIVYINRYNNGTPQVAFCKGFQLKRGALASSVSHDSHNIIAVGCSDQEIAQAINALIEAKGGVAVTCQGDTTLFPLPIAGIMSDQPGAEVSQAYLQLEEAVHQTGSTLEAPLMTLAFMSLIVIPQLKLGEKGLFHYERFEWLESPLPHQ